MKCQLCRYPFDRKRRSPLVLPRCGHTFCSNCIHEEGTGQRFECPLDENVYDLRGGSTPLPPNTIVMGLLGTVDSLCPVHDKPMEYFCLEDREEICANCALFGPHRQHELSQTSEFGSFFTSELRKMRGELSGLIFQKNYAANENFADLLREKLGEKFRSSRKRLLAQLEEAQTFLRDRLFEQLEKFEAECLENVDKSCAQSNAGYFPLRKKVLELSERLDFLERSAGAAGGNVKAALASLAKFGERLTEVRALYARVEPSLLAVSRLNLRADINFERLASAVSLHGSEEPPQNPDDSIILHEHIRNPINPDFSEEEENPGPPRAPRTTRPRGSEPIDFFNHRQSVAGRGEEEPREEPGVRTLDRVRANLSRFNGRQLYKSFEGHRQSFDAGSEANFRSMVEVNRSPDPLDKESVATSKPRPRARPSHLGVAPLPVTIKGKTLDKETLLSQLLKTLSTAKRPDRLNFSNCIFACEPISVLLEAVKKPLPSPFTVDFRKNRFLQAPKTDLLSVAQANNLKVIV